MEARSVAISLHVCLFVCPGAYLKKQIFKLRQIFGHSLLQWLSWLHDVLCTSGFSSCFHPMGPMVRHMHGGGRTIRVTAKRGKIP